MSSSSSRRGDSSHEGTGAPQSAHPSSASQEASPKTLQLCRQVEEAVAEALWSAHNALLRDLLVVGAEPKGGPGHIEVLIQTDDPNADESAIEDALARATSYLRREVGASIHRKRVPHLTLTLLPPLWREEESP